MHKDVMIFEDIITYNMSTPADYVEIVEYDDSTIRVGGANPYIPDATARLDHYSVEVFKWNEVVPDKYNDDGSPKIIGRTMHYATTKEFKEKFKPFFEILENTKHDKAVAEYDLSSLKRKYTTLESEYDDLLEDSSFLVKCVEVYMVATFWQRLKYLFTKRL